MELSGLSNQETQTKRSYRSQISEWCFSRLRCCSGTIIKRIEKLTSRIKRMEPSRAKPLINYQNKIYRDSSHTAYRLVEKDGRINVNYTKSAALNLKHFKDIFHTIIDMKWRFITGLFITSFLSTWLLFATAWYAISSHDTPKGSKCVANIDGWLAALLYSIETQTTIGYGGRAVASDCMAGIIMLMLQTITGMFVNCAMLGLLFAKFSRPKNRGKTTMTSKNAVISTTSDGRPCLMFRYVDICHRRLFDTNVRAVLAKSGVTADGDFVPLEIIDLNLTLDTKREDTTLRLFPLFPQTISHVIDENSPLYMISKSQLETSYFEVILIVEGTVPTTGSSTQVITSYLPSEILWGYRFPKICFHSGLNVNRIDLSSFDDVIKDDETPLCFAECYAKNKQSCIPDVTHTLGAFNTNIIDNSKLQPQLHDLRVPSPEKTIREEAKLGKT